MLGLFPTLVYLLLESCCMYLTKLSFCTCMCTLLLGVFLDVKLLDHRLGVQPAFVDTAWQPPKVLNQFTLSPGVHRSSSCSVSMLHILSSRFQNSLSFWWDIHSITLWLLFLFPWWITRLSSLDVYFSYVALLTLWIAYRSLLSIL